MILKPPRDELSQSVNETRLCRTTGANLGEWHRRARRFPGVNGGQ
jgi:hypothetical protein